MLKVISGGCFLQIQGFKESPGSRSRQIGDDCSVLRDKSVFPPIVQAEKQEKDTARKMQKNKKLFLKQRFKKASEFFPEFIDGVRGRLEVPGVFQRNSAAVGQVVFIEQLRQFG